MQPQDDQHGMLDPAAIRWRRRLLRDGGLGADLARAVARDERYDVHELLTLLERGCPPALALDILAPLDDRRTPT
jgi:hypothetical protein